MPNYASAQIIGHISRDPEQRGQFASTSVAVNSKGKDGPKATWFRVSCYGKDADALMKLKKGDAAMFVGTPELNEFTTKTGEVKQSLELSFSRVVFISGKGDGQRTGGGDSSSGGAREPKQPADSFGMSADDSDIPFAWQE